MSTAHSSGHSQAAPRTPELSPVRVLEVAENGAALQGADTVAQSLTQLRRRLQRAAGLMRQA